MDLKTIEMIKTTDNIAVPEILIHSVYILRNIYSLKHMYINLKEKKIYVYI